MNEQKPRFRVRVRGQDGDFYQTQAQAVSLAKAQRNNSFRDSGGSGQKNFVVVEERIVYDTAEPDMFKEASFLGKIVANLADILPGDNNNVTVVDDILYVNNRPFTDATGAPRVYIQRYNWYQGEDYVCHLYVDNERIFIKKKDQEFAAAHYAFKIAAKLIQPKEEHKP